MPFRDLTFNVYPGKLINNFDFDYRQKMENLMTEGNMNSVGNSCLWRCIGLENNFKALGFVNIGAGKENLNTWLGAFFNGLSGKMS